MSEQVVITGVGPVTSIGIGRKSYWQSAVDGKSGAVRLDWPEEILRTMATKIGAPVRGFDSTQYGVPAKNLDILDPVSQFALAGTWLALEDAGLTTTVVDRKKSRSQVEGVEPSRLAVILGTGIGGITTTEESHGRWISTLSKPRCKRYSLPMLIPNAPAAQTAIRYGAEGECKTITTACAAGTMAIGDAFRLLRSGEADVAITGGTEALLTGSTGYSLLGFDLLRTLSTRNDEPERASRPFDRDRDGFVMGEGAGILILERLEFAKARGARRYAEILSYEANCDAYSIIMLEPDGKKIADLFRQVVRKAGLEPKDIAYINAHGTSTIPNDRIESRVFKQVFGSHAGSLAISSTKSMIGHAMGASGAIEAITTALTVATGVITPTINLDNPDPECDLDYVPRKAREARVQVAVSSSYGFGGHNSALVLTAV